MQDIIPSITVGQIIGFIVSGFLAVISILVGVFVRREVKRDAELKKAQLEVKESFEAWMREQIKSIWVRIDEGAVDRKNISFMVAGIKGSLDKFYQEHQNMISMGVHKK